jgi:uncharacterized protein YjiS (DUF1127 family)
MTSAVNVYASLRPARRSYWDAIKRYLIERKHYFVEWRIRSRTRFELSTMDDRELWDIGVTRGAARFEATKPFWQQ